jgi:hypothetical protein
VAHQATIEQLESWRNSGATWRVLETTDRRVSLELCTCSGEPMDLVETDDPEVMAYLRRQPRDD